MGSMPSSLELMYYPCTVAGIKGGNMWGEKKKGSKISFFNAKLVLKEIEVFTFLYFLKNCTSSHLYVMFNYLKLRCFSNVKYTEH